MTRRAPRARGAREDALVLYARTPRPGAVKTRMVPWLSPGEALRLHVALVEDALALLRASAAAAGATPYVSFSEAWEPVGSGLAGLARAAGEVARLPQRGADLGERLGDTFATLFSRGLRRVVVIGSDSPTLPPSWVASAFEALRGGAAVVLGPADDGGYVLVGAARRVPEMFAGVPWGSDRVLDATLERLARAGLRPILLPRWYDVDRPADLERVRDDLDRGAAPGRAPFAPERTRAFIESLARDGRLPPSRPEAIR